MNNATPLMTQYRDIKSRYDNCVLLFRVGDFYETFYEDAVDVARILNIALTTRDKNKPNPIPLAGVPFHAAETYINRLLSAGKRVAICEQVEDAAQAKGLVKRDVVEVLTPGTAMNDQLLEAKENNYCLAVCAAGEDLGVALLDVSTGEFLVGQGDFDKVQRMLQGKSVRELLYTKDLDKSHITELMTLIGDPFVTVLEDMPKDRSATDAVPTQFDGETPAALRDGAAARMAADVLLAHCQKLTGGVLPQIVTAKGLGDVAFMSMDDETIRNLELFQPLVGADRRATLIKLVDRTLTPMGGREMRSWLERPLYRIDLIEERQDAVAALYASTAIHESLAAALKKIHDMERIGARIAARKSIPREFHALRESLEALPALKRTLSDCNAAFLKEAGDAIVDHSGLVDTIGRAIVDDPPGHLRGGGVIRHGFASELDTLIESNEAAKKWIANLEKQERERTGIQTLKVGFNKVFGYYIEASKAHRQSIPDDYIAKQTLVNAERYYTPTLKEKEQQILDSEDKRVACEQKVYETLCQTVSGALPALQASARAISRVDAIQSLAHIAKRHGYRRPLVDESTQLELVRSRHPVLEHLAGEAFVPNELAMDRERKQFALITGPNMSGKSTFLRQVALIIVLAQMGSFVPADRARIGVFDQIFTRVGASDRLSRGESTFLVEMKETSYILEHMTDRSLVLLDEVGRGTSTFDGLSIAWAVTEYILQGIKARPKTLFATHFHELTQLKSIYPRLVNLKITIREWEGGIVFLRKIVPGTSDRSYGIHAAKVAGLPVQVLKRAQEILESLEERRDLLRQGVDTRDNNQFSLFDPPSKSPPERAGSSSTQLDGIRTQLAAFDIDTSTPLDALKLIENLQSLLDGEPPV